MRTIALGFLALLLLTCSFGCARYESRAPVQDQDMLPIRYQINTNQHNYSLYNNNANYIDQNKRITGVRVSKEVARAIQQSYPGVEAVSVVIIKNKAYVAVTLNASEKGLLGDLRYQIPALVKDMEPTVEKVYLSDNPNFRRMIEQYQK